MKIPNAEKAVVDISKLRDYCLNPKHEVGKHKARVFASALGLSVSDAAIFQSALLEAVRTDEALPGALNRYGQRYIVDFRFEHNERSALVRSVWIIDPRSTIPRLITCLVLE